MRGKYIDREIIAKEKDYAETAKELDQNRELYIKCIQEYERISKASNCIISYPLDKIKKLIDTYKLLEFIVTQREKDKFKLTILTYLRIAIGLHVSISKTLDELLKKCNVDINNSEICKAYSFVKDRINEIDSLRGSIQHDLDPMYGSYDEIRKNFSLKDQFELTVDYLKILELVNNSRCSQRKAIEEIDYKPESLLNLKVKIMLGNEKRKEVLLILTEMSKRSDDIDKEYRKRLLDLSVKYLALTNLIQVVYNNSENIDKELDINLYEYFNFVGFQLAYQIFDKIGAILNDKLCLRMESPRHPYFNRVINELDKRDSKLDSITQEIYGFSKTPEYQLMRKIRNFEEHKNLVDYSEQDKKISTLIINLENSILSIIHQMLSEWVETNAVEISSETRKEAEINSLKQRL